MKYLVIGNIKQDGKPLKIGTPAEFDAAEGDRLVAGGYLAALPAADAAESTAPAKSTGKK